MDEMQRVLVLGGVSYDTAIYLDVLPTPAPQTIFSRGTHETVGSTGAGKALNLNRLGLPVTLHALIGDDPPGQAIRAYFARERLAFVYDLDLRGTERHVNLMDQDGRRISIFIATGTFEPAIDRQRLTGLIAQSDVVALNIVNYCRSLIPVVQGEGRPIWCDIHDYDGINPYHQDFIDAADYLFMSADALPDYRSFMQSLHVAGKQLVVCTRGKDGAIALLGDGRWIETPALLSYPLVDTNGAGDAFFAGVLYSHVSGYPIEICLRLGAIVGGLCITSHELVAPTLSPATLAAEYRRHYGTDLLSR
jgi:sugar/nucleoside kinase (ribokinase family)